MDYMARSFPRCSTSVCSVPTRLGSGPQGKHRTLSIGAVCATWNRKSGGGKSQTAQEGDWCKEWAVAVQETQVWGNSTLIVDLAGSFTFDREEKMKDSESAQVLVAEVWTGNPSGGAFLLRELRWRSAPGQASGLQVPGARR